MLAPHLPLESDPLGGATPDGHGGRSLGGVDKVAAPLANGGQLQATVDVIPEACALVKEANEWSRSPAPGRSDAFTDSDSAHPPMLLYMVTQFSSLLAKLGSFFSQAVYVTGVSSTQLRGGGFGSRLVFFLF